MMQIKTDNKDNCETFLASGDEILTFFHLLTIYNKYEKSVFYFRRKTYFK